MGFLGMRGTGNFGTDERPLNWREGILRLYPNGMAPLTAITSKLSKRNTDDPNFNWWTQTLAAQAGAITGVYTDAALSSDYIDTGVAGSVLYIKCAEATAKQFRAGYQALLRCSTDPTLDVNAKVTEVIPAGVSSRISVKLLEADDNSTSNYLASADRILAIGTMQPEGASLPEAISHDPTKIENYTQIFEQSLDITRTALKTRLRSEPAYQKTKKDALEDYSMLVEKAFIWGIPSENIVNQQKERTTGGVAHFIKTYASDNVDAYNLNTDFSGKTWLQGGEDWLDTYLERIFRYGKDEKLGFCGSGAMLGVNQLAKQNGNIQITPMTTSYGIRVMEYRHSSGVLYLKTHPLFSYESTNRNTLMIIEPEKLQRVVIDETHFKPDVNYGKGGNSKDGKNESWLSEEGLEVHFPQAFGLLNGVGSDNSLT